MIYLADVTREMEFGSFDGRIAGEYSDLSFVDISKIFVIQENISYLQGNLFTESFMTCMVFGTHARTENNYDKYPTSLISKDGLMCIQEYCRKNL